MKKSILSVISTLIIASVSSQTITYQAANPVPVFTDSDVGAMALADIDNDGDNDFVTTGKGGPIRSSLYLNDGSGNFTEVINAPFVDVYAGEVGFVDVNNDNFIDVFITGQTSAPAATSNLYINNGAGNFEAADVNPFEPTVGGGFSFGDIDGDGDQDLALTGYDLSGNAFTALYINDGLGNFSEVFGTPFIALLGSSVEFIDIENDNDQDLIFCGKDDNDISSVVMYLNDGTGNYSLITDTSFTACAEGGISIGDSDNDGDQDILISGITEGGTPITNLYVNDGAGSFSLVNGTPFFGQFSGQTDFADLDLDGDLDVVIVGISSPDVISHVYENLGSNAFILSDELPKAYLSSTAIGDIDGDNDLDIIIGGTSFEFPFRATKTYLNQGVLGCPADFNGDFTINVEDLLLLLSYFGCDTDCISGDLNNDGIVNAADMLDFLAQFGEDC